ncbi:MAG TPA: FHA domain-containing protein [Propionibacteriaceae bacterium]
MAPALARWRAAYEPGEWVVLAGPTSLVVIQPLAPEWSALISTLWDEVLGAGTMADLADQLVVFGVADMPSFGAFFWTEQGMRSLVRGAVVVRDADTHQVLADGQGVQTWSEVGLAGIERFRIEMPHEEPAEQPMELPLVVGAVRASVLTLDATPDALARSWQGVDRESLREEDLDEDLPDEAFLDEDPPGRGQPDPGPDEVELASTELLVPSPETDANFMAEPPTQPEHPLSPARLVLSDGHRVDLDVAVRIGRAPSPAPVGDGGWRAEPRGQGAPKLVTVLSPNADISRTHLQIEPDAGRVVVTDLNSTNGTVLVRPEVGVLPERLPAGQAVTVPLGSVLELGDGVSVQVEPPS